MGCKCITQVVLLTICYKIILNINALQFFSSHFICQTLSGKRRMQWPLPGAEWPIWVPENKQVQYFESEDLLSLSSKKVTEIGLFPSFAIRCPISIPKVTDTPVHFVCPVRACFLAIKSVLCTICSNSIQFAFIFFPELLCSTIIVFFCCNGHNS